MPYYGALSNAYFQPLVTDIIAITNAYPLQVTTSFAHNYLTGLIVRIYIPKNFGMVLLNGAQGSIIVNGETTFTMNVDSTNFDAFVVPSEQPGNNFTPAQTVPIGEDADILTQSFVNILTPQF